MTRTFTFALVNGLALPQPPALQLAQRPVRGVAIDCSTSSIGASIYRGFSPLPPAAIVVQPGQSIAEPIDDAWAIYVVFSGVPTVASGSLRVTLYDYPVQPHVFVT